MTKSVHDRLRTLTPTFAFSSLLRIAVLVALL